MKPIYLVSILSLQGIASAYAQSPTPTPHQFSGNLTVINQDRYLGVGSTKKLFQDNITLKGCVDLNGIVQIIALAQTGNTYSLGYNTAYDDISKKWSTVDAATQLHLKRIYLKKTMMNGNLSVSAGAMDTRNGIAQTNALSGTGWIDGARAELKTKVGAMTFTAGQINTASPDAFKRFQDPSLNYFEVTLSRKVFEKMLVEGGVERFEGKDFIEAASKYDIEIAANKVIKLVGDAKIETDNGAYKVGAGVQDILSLISNKISDVKLAVNYEYVSAKFNTDMNKLANPMHSGYTGGAVITGLQYPIVKKYGISGFTNVRVGNERSDFRVETGIAKTIFNKTFKKKTK